MSLTQFHDQQPKQSEFLHDVVSGLSQPQKVLPCKYFYDERGSKLFDQICELREYYPTRTELGIMHRHAREMAFLLGPGVLLIEFGSGTSLKTRVLLRELSNPAGYVPIDISREHLLQSARQLEETFPAIEILPVCADYNQPFKIPSPSRQQTRNIVYFPGSTIGNLHKAQAESFLRRIAEICGRDGALLIGVDLKKDPAVLEAAYNDSKQVTAQFNKNMLERINNELNADFNVDSFEHRAWFNSDAGRIEMHLVSKQPQTVHFNGTAEFHFQPGETIRTECSYKYDLAGFAQLANRSGLVVERVWTDFRRYFSVQYLTVA